MKISAADVQLNAREVEVGPKVADRQLREKGANVFNAACIIPVAAPALPCQVHCFVSKLLLPLS